MSIPSLTRYSLDVKIVIVAAIYYLAALLGYFLLFNGSDVLPIWPPSGVAFALLILLGRKCWPGITIGALIANIMAFWNMPELSTQAVIGISSLIAVGNTTEALLGNYLIKNWIKNPFPFTQTKNTFRFLFISVLIAATGSAVAAGSLFLHEVITFQELSLSWLSYGVGKTVGILLFTPFVLSIFQKVEWNFTKEKLVELAIAVASGILLYMLLSVPDMTISRALPFLVIPFLLWLAFRFPLTVSMSAVVGVSILSMYLTAIETGPFILAETYSSMLLLQIYIGVVSITTIILAATVKERSEAQSQLLKFNENLEEMVKIRTKALNDQIETRKRTETDLKKTNDELSKRNVELDNFVYSVSHDLRAPIASVLGIINLAKKEDDVVMKDMYFDMINGSANQLDNFIKEILDQSRNTRLDLNNDKVFFKEVINEAFDQLKFSNKNNKPVEKHIQIKQRGAFITDEWRVKVILNNIISNAIRYRNGKDPVIDIDVNVKRGNAEIIIQDNGRGIEKEHLTKVFDMFYRATDDNAGSGLGLYIVKETIEKLNGSIEIKSKLGEGTTVILNIPELSQEKETKPKRKKEVIVAED